MKFNDFKKLTPEHMKQILGGISSLPPEEGCFPDGSACGSGKKCNFDSSIGSCLCGSEDDGSCYRA